MSLEIVLCTLAMMVRILCHFITKYHTLINSAITASGETQENKDKLVAVVNAADAVCGVIDVFVYPPF